MKPAYRLHCQPAVGERCTTECWQLLTQAAEAEITQSSRFEDLGLAAAAAAAVATRCGRTNQHAARGATRGKKQTEHPPFREEEGEEEEEVKGGGGGGTNSSRPAEFGGWIEGPGDAAEGLERGKQEKKKKRGLDIWCRQYNP